METQFFLATVFNLGLNLLYTLLALMVGVVALRIVDQQLLKGVDIQEQLQKGNIAVAIFCVDHPYFCSDNRLIRS